LVDAIICIVGLLLGLYYVFVIIERLTAYLFSEKDIVVESGYGLGREYDDTPVYGLAGGKKAGKNKKKKVVMENQQVLVNLKGLIFTPEEMVSYDLPGFARKLRWEDLSGLMNSLQKTMDRKKSYREVRDAFRAMKANWNLPGGKDCIANFIIEMYGSSGAVYSNFNGTGTQVYAHHTYVYHPELHLDYFEGAVCDAGDPNVCYPYDIIVSENTSKNKQLSIQTIKSILNTTKDKDRDYIMNVFRKKTEVPKKYEPGSINWVVPFISYDALTLRYNDENKDFWKTLKGKMEGLRTRILNYVSNFLEIRALTPYRRKCVLRKMSDYFKEQMRSPEIQRLFVQGVPKKEIIEEVFNDNITRMRVIALQSDEVGTTNEKNRQKREVNRTRDRDYKYGFNVEAGFFAPWLTAAVMLVLTMYNLNLWWERMKFEGLFLRRVVRLWFTPFYNLYLFYKQEGDWKLKILFNIFLARSRLSNHYTMTMYLEGTALSILHKRVPINTETQYMAISYGRLVSMACSSYFTSQRVPTDLNKIQNHELRQMALEVFISSMLVKFDAAYQDYVSSYYNLGLCMPTPRSRMVYEDILRRTVEFARVPTYTEVFHAMIEFGMNPADRWILGRLLCNFPGSIFITYDHKWRAYNIHGDIVHVGHDEPLINYILANTLAYDWAHNLLPPAADPQTRVVAYLNDVNVESFIQVLAHNRQGDRITREDFEEHRNAFRHWHRLTWADIAGRVEEFNRTLEPAQDQEGEPMLPVLADTVVVESGGVETPIFQPTSQRELENVRAQAAYLDELMSNVSDGYSVQTFVDVMDSTRSLLDGDWTILNFEAMCFYNMENMVTTYMNLAPLHITPAIHESMNRNAQYGVEGHRVMISRRNWRCERAIDFKSVPNYLVHQYYTDRRAYNKHELPKLFVSDVRKVFDHYMWSFPEGWCEHFDGELESGRPHVGTFLSPRGNLATPNVTVIGRREDNIDLYLWARDLVLDTVQSLRKINTTILWFILSFLMILRLFYPIPTWFIRVLFVALYCYDRETFHTQFAPKIVATYTGVRNTLERIWFGTRPRSNIDIVADWVAFVTNPTSHKLDSENKLFMTNVIIGYNSIKSYLAGNRDESFRHLSYLLATEPELIVSILTSFTGLFSKKNIVLEAGGYNELYTAIAGILAAKGVWKMSDADIRRWNQIGSLVNHAQRTANQGWTMVESFITILSMGIFSIDPFDKGYQLYVKKLLDLNAVMDMYNNMDSTLRWRKEVIEELLRKHEEVLKLMGDVKFEKAIPNFIVSRFMTAFGKFDKIRQEVNEFISSNRDRAEPVFVMFCGPPGVGKSTTMELVKQYYVYFNYQYMDPKTREELRVPKKFDNTLQFVYDGSEYFEGYKSGDPEAPAIMIVIVDDFCQSNSEDEKRKQVMFVFRAVNNAPASLNMAFGSKGNVYFTSPAVIGSTNIFNGGFPTTPEEVAMYPIPLGVHDPAAFFRRVGLAVYRDEKIGPDANINDLRWTVQQCVRFPNMVGKDLTAAEIAKLMLRINGVNKLHQNALKISEELCQEELNKPFNVESGRMNNNNREEEESEEEPAGIIDPEEVELATAPSPLENFQRMVKDGIYPWLKSEYAYALIGIAVILFAYLLINKIRGMWGNDAEEVVAEAMHTSYTKKTPGIKKTKQLRVAKAFEAQSGENFDLNSINKITHDMCTIEYQGFLRVDTNNVGARSVFEKSGQLIHLRDGIFLTARHVMNRFVDYMEDEKYVICVRLTTPHGVLRIRDVVIDYAFMNLADLCVFSFKNWKFNLPAAQINRLVDAEKYPALETGYPLCVSIRSNELVEYHNVLCNEKLSPLTYDDDDGVTYVLKHCLRYEPKTRSGWSGGAITCPDKNKQMVIIGIHTGKKDGKVSVGMAISRQMVEYAIDHMDNPGGRVEPESGVPEGLKCGTVTIPSIYPTKTNIRQGHLYNAWHASNYIPAKLKPFVNSKGDVIDPYEVACSKLPLEHFRVTLKHERRAHNYLKKCYPDNDTARLLTWQECAEGVSELGIRPINLGTSPGYQPHLVKVKGKAQFVQMVEGSYVIDPTFLNELESIDVKLRGGGEHEFLFARALKDELRPKEKAEMGKTRLFLAAPIQLLFVMRRYFQAFFAYVQSRHVESPCAVGINAHSIEWELLYNRLNIHKGSVIAGDFANYDGTLPQDVLLSTVRFINNWYNGSQVDDEVRVKLIKYITESHHVNGYDIFQVMGAIPSGVSGTSFLGSIPQVIMMCEIHFGYMDIDESGFEMTVYGDDNVITTRKKGLRTKDYEVHFKHLFNMSYTHWSKEEKDEDGTMENINFLKRKFVKRDNDGQTVVAAPMELTEILEIVYWRKKNLTCDQALIAQIEAVAIELFHHGRDVFDKYLDMIFSVAKRRCPLIVETLRNRVKSYDQYSEAMYGSYGGIKQVFDDTEAW